MDSTEIGLGIGAVATSILTYFGNKVRKARSLTMASIEKRLSIIEVHQSSYENSFKVIMDNSNTALAELRTEIKELKVSTDKIALSAARLEGIYEATSKRD